MLTKYISIILVEACALVAAGPMNALASRATTALASAPALPTLTYLFNVQIGLQRPLTSVPMALGGLQDIEPFTNGTIAGPALNATIKGGLAYPLANGKDTLRLPRLTTYGTSVETAANATSESFFVQGVGQGQASEQWASLTFTIGGAYAYLQDIFAIGNIVPDGLVVNVECWCVGCTDAQIKKIEGKN